MPKYRVQLSDGRVVTVEAAQPPTEQQILAQMGSSTMADRPPAQSSWVDTAIDALPNAAAMVGSFAGAGRWNPLGTAGAALGGMAGEGLKQTANAIRGRYQDVPATISGRLKQIGAAGATQAGLEAGGQTLSRAVIGGGRALYAGGTKLLPPTLKKEFKDLARTGFQEGVSLTKRGLRKVKRLASQSSDEADALIAAREAARPRVRGFLPEGRGPVPLGSTPSPSGGIPSTQGAQATERIPWNAQRSRQGMSPDPQITQYYGGMPSKGAAGATADIVSGPGTVLLPLNAPPGTGKVPGMISLDEATRYIPGVRRDIASRALGRNEPGLQQINRLERRMATGRQWPAMLSDAQRLKRAEQTLAQNAYRAKDAGKIVQLSPRAQFAEQVARGTREAIEREVPGVAPINQRTQSLLGMERAAAQASDTGHILSRLGGAGVAGVIGFGGGVLPAAAAAGAGLMLTTPGGLTALGLGAKRLGQGLRYGPQGTRAIDAATGSNLEQMMREALLRRMRGGER